jgi:4-amino-4-deoxy-L-arabinose transferase-like glycosyltransferase
LPNESAETPVPARLRGKTLVALSVLALAVRLLFIGLEPPTRTVGDERTWLTWAFGCPGPGGVRGLACPEVGFSPFRTRLIFYPPLYPYFLAGLGEAVAGGELYPDAAAGATRARSHAIVVPDRALTAIKLGQAVLGALLVVALARLGAALFGARAGGAAGLLAALYPDLAWYAAHFWSETLFLAFLWWGMERLVAADGAPGFRAAVAAGALWGLAVLTRETNLYFVPVAAVWLAWGRAGSGRRKAAAFALAAIVVVAPWTYRNWLTLDAFIPVSTAGGQNLFQGNATLERDDTYRMVEQQPGRVEQYRFAMSMGLKAIRARQPWWIFEKLRDEMPNFWEADSLALIHVKRGAYGDVSVARAWIAAAVVELPYLFVLAGFVLALGRIPWSRAAVLLLLFVAYYNALHIVTHGFARYRLPIMPVLFLFAAWRIAMPGSWVPLSARRRALVVACALVLAACLAPGVRMNLGHPAFGGAGERSVAPEGQDAPS